MIATVYLLAAPFCGCNIKTNVLDRNLKQLAPSLILSFVE